jgi:hypothetical protein
MDIWLMDISPTNISSTLSFGHKPIDNSLFSYFMHDVQMSVGQLFFEQKTWNSTFIGI